MAGKNFYFSLSNINWFRLFQKIFFRLKIFGFTGALTSSISVLHAQAMNEYREGEMSTEVVVDRNFVDGSESVLRAWLRGRTFDFRMHGPSSRPVMTLFIYLHIFSFLFFFLT